MVKYKLYYFDITGRAEIIRMIFAYAGVEYEDIRIPLSEWPERKKEMPLGQMPCLEVDGNIMVQSGPIYRYLAREYGLVGKNSKEEYYIDMFCACFDDLGQKLPFSERDEIKREALVKIFLDEIIPPTFAKIEKLMGKCESPDGFYATKLSIADLYLLAYGDLLIPMKSDLFAGTPKLEAVYKRARKVSSLLAWIARRPKSEY